MSVQPGSLRAPLHLPPDQLMTILAPKRVVNLLQFAWPLAHAPVQAPSSVPATPPNTAGNSRRASATNIPITAAQPCSASPPLPVSALDDSPAGLQGTVTLSDSLLGDDRLLRQFLLQGLAGLQQVSRMGGACVGHRDCPGPGDLQVVEEKLQRQHDTLVEQLRVRGCKGLHRRMPACSCLPPLMVCQGCRTSCRAMHLTQTVASNAKSFWCCCSFENDTSHALHRH
jgi:hypothetical protein